MRTGVCNLPLHTGSCPKWLFPRMVGLSKAISAVLIGEFGPDEFLSRLANPYWFQALGCVIGFDWHSSGLTTTTLGALKEALNKENLGIYFAGGKGKASRKTLDEIENASFGLSSAKIERLKYSSRMSAKVDTCLLQDSYQLYHHSFVFDEKGSWAVIQQGMNAENHYARRYHWLSGNIASFVSEPHNAICGNKKENTVLDMTAKESEESQKISLDLVNDNPKHLEKYTKGPIQKTLGDFNSKEIIKFSMLPRHTIIDMDKRNFESLRKAYEIQPGNYEELVSVKGIGPKTIRSLALVSDLIYGAKASWKDPVKYSFALGGKDKVPYEIDRNHYDKIIGILQSAINNAKLGDNDKLHAIKRLNHFLEY
ncbi:DUF763 domain-containing protein [Candidatus Woesearchaeota archaeon]|nr:DUF763 domain-containing protein [Candidatus Woesearchaeota archaeon]